MKNKRKEKKIQRRKHRKEKSKKRKFCGLLRWMDSSYPLINSWINQDWQSSSIASIIVARSLPSGLIVFVNFYINTASKEIEECMGYSHILKKKFYEDFIDVSEVAPVMLKIDLELVKQILYTTIEATKGRNEELPKNCGEYLKFVGALEHLPNKINPDLAEEIFSATKNKEEIFKENQADNAYDGPSYSTRFCYQTKNPEEVELEIRLLPDIEEEDASGKYKFHWMEARRKDLRGLFLQRELALLTIDQNKLYMDVVERRQADELNDTLLRCLGSGIDLLEKQDLVEKAR